MAQLPFLRDPKPLNSIAAEAKGQEGRVRPHGKFFFLNQDKFYVKGVSYGPFGGPEQGEYRSPRQTREDFARIRSLGGNAIRTYTPPPRWLLDVAGEHGLQVLLGLPWEQHVAFLDGRQTRRRIERRIRDGVGLCASHPAVLGCAVGNEIPSPVVRWHGKRRIEGFLKRIYLAAKEADPEMPVTYVNYPSTEYLQLPFLDFFSMNVYLESRPALAAYLKRMQHLAGNRPLLIGELGIDSRRHGLRGQAEVLQWQIEEVFAAGAGGLFVFSWADQWHRGGAAVEDWDFGLTDRGGGGKPALDSVRRSFSSVPLPRRAEAPFISVVVCVYNGQSTIRDCLEGLQKLHYARYEVLVVDDGSTDETSRILEWFRGRAPFRIVRTANRGLSNARNLGVELSRGEIVAFLDADAYPDPDWLSYLADHFAAHADVGVGGPNIAPGGHGIIEECISMAPGGPVHVMISDREAEHVPGCNMAFRKDALQAVGGFDPLFRVAGDDVDLCWRMQERSWTLGFCPAALVWHRSRPSIRHYWNQQKGYGRAEALLECKWPAKYNTLGYPDWKGRIYDGGLTQSSLLGRWRIYHGVWGSGLFQSLYAVSPGLFSTMPLTPDWHLITVALALIAVLGVFWPPLLLAAPVALACFAASVATAVSRVRAAFVRHGWQPRPRRLKLFLITLLLHLLQPLARLRGRLGRGVELTRRSGLRLVPPPPRSVLFWNENWQPPEGILAGLEKTLSQMDCVVIRGGHWDAWDLEVRGGVIGAARLQMLAEAHNAGRQLVRFRVSPHWSREGVAITSLFAGLAGAAALDGSWAGSLALGGIALFFALRGLFESAAAAGSFSRVLADDPRRVQGGAR